MRVGEVIELPEGVFRVSAVRRLVIVSDGRTAIRFAAWREKDIIEEIEEHFPAKNVTMIELDEADEELSWPYDTWDNVILLDITGKRQPCRLPHHEVACSEVPWLAAKLEAEQRKVDGEIFEV